MTVSADSRRREYQGNGVTTIFNGPMAYQASHIHAFLRDGSGNLIRIPESEYTVARLGQEAGTRVEMELAPPSGHWLLLLRTVPYTQELDVTNQGAFNAREIEKGFDAISMQVQQLSDGVNRSIRFSDLAPDDYDTELPAPSPLQVLGWDMDGKSLRNIEIDGFSEMTIMVSMISRDNRSLIMDLFDRSVEKPEISLLVALDTLIGQMKKSGAWGSSDIFYLPCLHDESVSMVNIANPDYFPLTPFGGVSFSPFKGISSDGVTGYYDTGFRITDEGFNFKKSEMDVAIWSIRDFQGLYFDVGVDNTTFNLTINPLSANQQLQFRALRAGGSSTNIEVPPEYRSRLGYTSITRTSESSVYATRQGHVVGTVADDNSSTNLQNSTITLFKAGNNFSPGGIRWFSAGAPLTPDQQMDRYISLSRFFTTLEGIAWK